MTAAKNKPATKSTATSPRTVHYARDNFRETIESVAIAFVLAFLFRTFEAEAFVIPTGSMAPTLMGQHKDLKCAQCGYPYRVGEEAPDEPRRSELVACTCPNCRYTMRFGPDFPTEPVPPGFKGDRIIVAKFPYEVEEPRRWDVSVFRYPMTAKLNYIKRLVGLPREALQIYHGDIFTRPEGGTTFKIESKPPSKLQAMMQVVYDNDYVLQDIIKGGWPACWQAMEPATGQGWQASTDGKSFTSSSETAEAWLRYRHYVPMAEDWAALERGPLGPQQKAAVHPQLIRDFYAYNTGETSRPSYQEERQYYVRGQHWVGDLALDCELNVQAGGGQVALELIEGGREFRATFDLATGAVILSASDLPDFHPQAQTSVRGVGTHRVVFANADDKLYLWIDGSFVKFDQSTSYELPWREPTAADRSPAAIAARGAQLEVKHLRVLRDVYYIADKNDVLEPDGRLVQTLEHRLPPDRDEPFPDVKPIEFQLAADQFLMFGDNSPRSKDSRLWWPDHYVDRNLLIGKAIFVFWPHALDHLPGTNITFPWFPNFGRMKFIR